MGDAHERYQRQVVGHVLDELDAPDAAEFRAHLMGCAGCRSRVAELRGIAADLAQVEAAERERVQVRTQHATDGTTGPGAVLEAGEGRVTLRYVTMAVIAVLVLATVMGFWNLHLRSSAATYLAAAEARGETLAGLADGTWLDVELSGGATGIAAIDGTAVSFVVSGFLPLDHDEQLIGWWLDGADAVAPPLRLAGPSTTAPATPSIAATLHDPGAQLLVITRERGIPGDAPTGAQLARIVLDDT